PENAREQIKDKSWWPALVEAFKQVIDANKSTLFFANSRRMTEKVTRFINEKAPVELAYSHHGSLSREIRLAVEQKLKNGELKAIVATNSLELGIDIGDLDQVVLIQAPPSISSAIQRIGRSGHGVGEVSSGALYPTHGRDFLDAAVIARSIMEQDIEKLSPVDAPLDVLAQVLLSMVVTEEWDIDELFGFIKTSYPYRDLSRRQFDLVLEMLSGRYADSRVRELNSRISIDRIDNRVKARDGAQYHLFLSGGTIPDRGLYDLRIQDSRAKIGELDEEFVWERSVGETFTLGAQTWRIQNITHNDVEVIPVQGRPGIIPFWRGEDNNRDFHFSEKISLFLKDANGKLDSGKSKSKSRDFFAELCSLYYMDEAAAEELIGFLERQRETTKQPLPHRHHILFEHYDDPMNRSDLKQVIIHTLWGGKINQPFSLALAAAWESTYKYKLEVMVNNDSILLMLPHAFDPMEIFRLVTPGNLETLLRQRLEQSGFFGARFRENAGRALLLPRASFNKRLPLWLNRLRSKKLFNAVLSYSDFPILLETWRTCLLDEFDLENTKMLLGEVQDGVIAISETITTKPSPFSDSLTWNQTNKYMYEDDTPTAGKSSSLSGDLIKEVASSSHLRPRIPEELIVTLEEKLKRTAPGYAPRSSEDLLDWVKERLLVPEEEWTVLLKAVKRDHEIKERALLTPIGEKLLLLNLPGAVVPSITAVETIPKIAALFAIERGALMMQPVPGAHGASPEELEDSLDRAFEDANKRNVAGMLNEDEAAFPNFLLQWLSYYGPVSGSVVQERFGMDEGVFNELLETLEKTESVLVDCLRENSDSIEICHSENLEILLRMARKARQPSFEALPVEQLQLFLASYQGLTRRGNEVEDLQDCLDRLFGYPTNPGAWEEYIFPARMGTYYTSWLDNLIQTSELLWFGCGDRKTSFSFRSDLDLFQENREEGGGGKDNKKGNKKDKKEDKKNDDKNEENPEKNLALMFPDKRGKYEVTDIMKYSGLSYDDVSHRLWQLTWKGFITNDAYLTLRSGIVNHFDPLEVRPGTRRRTIYGFDRWLSDLNFKGGWFLLNHERFPGSQEDDTIERDILEEQELIKDRVRVLFKRYGILFRELLARELPPLRWARVFRTLRLMELSGEILTGYFFEGIPGLQFISQEAFRFLNQGLDEEVIYWINAADPVSLSGMKLESLKGELPSRLQSNYLVYHGTRKVITAGKSCKTLEIAVPPDHPRLVDYLLFLRVLVNRSHNPMHSIRVEIINDSTAVKSEYADFFKEFGFRADEKYMVLFRRI
ncbi:MAG: ATP-dependent helicase, partial [bacterium]|nr:ATP-dependent helicase [bacterium]